MNIVRLYALGKKKHTLGFRGMVAFIVLIGFMPGGIALFVYEGWRTRDVEWIAVPLIAALAIAAFYSIGIVLSARRSERDLREFKLRLMGVDKLAERIADQARWNPEAKEALERYCARTRESRPPSSISSAR